MAGNGFIYDDKPLTVGLVKFDDKLRRFVQAAIDYTRATGEAWMKGNARWTDRSGNARGGLHTVSVSELGKNSDRHTIIFAHSVSYGIWLEVRWSGRYAIIMPTVQREAGLLMSRLDKGLSRLA